MTLTLYKLDPSPPARAVMMAIEALGLTNVEYKDVNVIVREQFKEEYVKLNPQHTVPTLKDGDFVIWDSHAIITYLIAKYGDVDPPLYPSDPETRAIIDQRMHFDTGNLFACLRGSVELIISKGAKEYNPVFFCKMEPNYEFMEKFLTKEWIAGDTFTIADICCVASISTMNEMLPIDKDKFPKLTSWLERCAQKDFYQKANVPGLKTFGEVFGAYK